MKTCLLKRSIVVLTGIYCVALLFGCSDMTTSVVSEPANGSEHVTDAETGYAAVPFEGVFKPQSSGTSVNPETINVEMGESGGLWGFFGDKIFDPEDGTNPYGFTIEGPDGNGSYTVSGTIDLLPGSYWVKTSCYPDGFGAYYSNGSDRAAFTVVSGFDPQNFVGGVHNFTQHSIRGTCFWISQLFPLLGFDGFLEAMVASMMTPYGIDVPGWDDLPVYDLLVSEGYEPLLPDITADVEAVAGEIAVTVHPTSIDIELQDPNEWMEAPVTFNGETFYICGLQFRFGPGSLQPVTPTMTDLEITFYDMAFYVAASLEGDCEVARATSLFDISTPLDALQTCECTSFYRGSNP